jgi:hypothetical protein
MSLILTEDDDRVLRSRARRLHAELGEDAYHTAVCEVLMRDHAETIRSVVGFFQVATRRALYKIFRHDRAEMEQTAAWLNDEPIPQHAGLAQGRQMHTHCRRGHPLTEENCAYIGARRTCRTCKREREARAGRAKRASQVKEVQYV